MSTQRTSWIGQRAPSYGSASAISSSINVLNLVLKGIMRKLAQPMDLLFELLAEIDTGNDEIIFFADEGGSWQVGLDDEKVLPAYFSSLAATATPEEYVNSVSNLIEERGAYDRDKFLKSARKVANAAQKKALGTRLHQQ
jgi:hypothetical protein